jgi:Protein of unknown function (DUF3570)
MIAKRLSVPSRTRKYFGLALCLAVLGPTAGSSFADQVEYTSYWFSDNKDNSVFTTSFNLAKTMWSRASLLLDIEMDQVTVPPVDAKSGASRPPRHESEAFKKNRGQIIVGLEQGIGENTSVTGSYYQSRETDYLSHSFIGSLKQELFQKNLTVEFRGQYTMDSVGEILKEGGVRNRFKETHQGNLSMTQLISPVMYIRFGGDIIRNYGFLSDPYRLVSGPTGTLVQEKHPNQRWRQAVWGELSRFIEMIHGSIVLNYRYYWDDWSVTSQTGQLKFNKYVTSNFILTPEYRYYIQKDADFGDYGKQETFYTGDYKLKAFESNNMGMGLTWLLRGMANNPDFDFLNGASIACLYFRYWNSLDFSGDVFEGRIKFDF